MGKRERKNVDEQRELPPGSRQRGKSIQVRVYTGFAKGQRQQATETVSTPAEAWDAWRRLKGQVENQEHVPPSRQKVEEYLDVWLKDSAKPNIKAKTYERYESLVRLHIKPHIGGVKLSKLAPRHVDSLLSALKGKVSDRTRLHVYRVLHRALEVAVRWRAVARNVCDAVEPPKADDPEMYVLSAEEVDRLLQAARCEVDLRSDEKRRKRSAKQQAEDDRQMARLYPLVLTALHTGMRQGELFALRWQDVDTQEGIAWVRRTLEDAGKNPAWGTPKNRKSRPVPLSEAVVSALTSLRIDQEVERSHYAQDYHDYDLIFCQENGRPMDGHSLARNSWKRLRERAGLPDSLRFHDLRHTFVSRSLAAGANPRAISDIAGHHDPGFTLRRYAHTLHDDRKAAVKALAAYLNGNDGQE